MKTFKYPPIVTGIDRYLKSVCAIVCKQVDGMNKERVDVRVEPELLEELEIIAQRMGINSRSSAIREAIASFVMDNKDGWNASGISVNIPNRIAERLQRQIMNGDAKDTDQAIVLALDFWLRDLETYYLSRREKIERIVSENMRTDDALDQLRKTGKKLEEL
jgi:metal-responsive CopG/Arc/MetJ family transcriptional regulator